MQTLARRADKVSVPGTLHQGILLLFLDDPWLAFDVLGHERPTTGMPIDRRGEIEREGPEPMSVRPGYPDLVLVDRDPTDEQVGVVIAIEAQKDRDTGKRWSIPVYQSHLAAEHQLDTWVVVISLHHGMSELLREWARGGPPRVDVLLLDVDTLPRSPWLDNDAQRPMAAILAGILHGYAGDLDAARIAFNTARALTSRRRHRHGLTVLAALPQHQRDQLIGELPVQEQHDWMDVERRSGTYEFGRQEGRQEGLQEGLQTGARAALRELIVSSLVERELPIDEASAAQIQNCEDLALLQRWARRAMTVTSVAQLFE